MTAPLHALLGCALAAGLGAQALAAESADAAPDPWRDFYLRTGAFSMPSDLFGIKFDGSVANDDQRLTLLRRIQSEANERANCPEIESVTAAPKPGSDSTARPDGSRVVQELWTLKQCGYRMPYVMTLTFPAQGKPTYHIAPQVPLLISAQGIVVTDEQVRKEYDDWVKVGGRVEYKVRHILVPKKEDAQAALDRIRKGESFEVVAKDVSTDTPTRSAGGDLGWNVPAYFAPPFAEAMLKLAPRGMVDAPVWTRFGWHVIEVTQARPKVYPPFEQVKDRIAQSLRKRADEGKR
ncbi:peptidylprolyl isomerase [Piscinibacter terrae]|nr:peptidylprolyl isomerase [Albitalea terrae]